MIKVATAKHLAKKGRIKDFAKHALIHISRNIGYIASKGGSSFVLPLDEYTDNRSLQEYGEFLILLGNKLQANGYGIRFDYRDRRFEVTW